MMAKTARLRLAGFVAAAAFAASAVTGAANAAGTDAGSTVSNTFTLDYQVGGTPQTQIDNTGTPTNFTVDRNVDLTVTSVGDTNVSPGANGQELVFGVRNVGNDSQAYEFDLKDVGGDDFDATGVTVRYYVDAGADNVFTPGVDDAGAGTAYAPGGGVGPASSDLAEDSTLWVIVSGNIPGSATNGQTDGVSLIANSLDPTAWVNEVSATPGAETAAAVGANTILGVAQNVLADGAGTAGAPEDVATDGAHSDTGNYNVVAADLTAGKTVSVIATDGVAITCATDPVVPGNQYAVPGACIEYVISASNAAGAAATATNIDIGDVLPDDVQYQGATQAGFTLAGTLTPPAGGAGCAAACNVALTGAQLAPGATGTLTIRALVR